MATDVSTGGTDATQIDRRPGAGAPAVRGRAGSGHGGPGGGGVRRAARAGPLDGAHDDGAAAPEGAPRPPAGGGDLSILLSGAGRRGAAGRGEVVRREDARRLRLPLRDLPDGRGRGLGRGPRRARGAGREAPVEAEGGGMSTWGIVGTLTRASIEGGLFIAGVWI